LATSYCTHDGVVYRRRSEDGRLEVYSYLEGGWVLAGHHGLYPSFEESLHLVTISEDEALKMVAEIESSVSRTPIPPRGTEPGDAGRILG
jgi:hypothetical protein